MKYINIYILCINIVKNGALFMKYSCGKNKVVVLFFIS